MKIGFYALSLLLFLFTSCTKRAIVKFDQKPPDLTSADVLTEIMLVSKSPRIVLRVPNTRKGVTNTQATGNGRSSAVNSNAAIPQAIKGKSAKTSVEEREYDETSLYNAIEKQLFKEGFSVRDRGLFNQVLDNNQSVDYTKIKELTDTDLILELVSLDGSVGYSTNVCYTDPDGQQRFIEVYKGSQGASVEFKLVYVKTNQIVGTYKIHYTPCLNGCRGLYAKKGLKGVFISSLWLKSGEKEQLRQIDKKAYQGPDQDELEAFIMDATRQLVKNMRR